MKSILTRYIIKRKALYGIFKRTLLAEHLDVVCINSNKDTIKYNNRNNRGKKQSNTCSAKKYGNTP
jgi:hypothetical protein